VAQVIFELVTAEGAVSETIRNPNDMVSVIGCVAYQVTASSKVIFEKLFVAQMIKKVPAFHGTQRFITMC
jgi:hypothetical protein